MQKRLRVYFTFFLGLCLSLAYALIISTRSSALVPAWLNVAEQRMVVLTFSGLLGGVAYTIIVDGNVELPRFLDRHGDRLEAGLLGDMLLGIAGAFILEFLAAPIGGPESGGEPSVGAVPSYIAIAAKGLIGGYGGKALMEVALAQMLKPLKTVQKQQEDASTHHWQLADEVAVLEREDAQLRAGDDLLAQLTVHLNTGLERADLDRAIAPLHRSPPEIQERLFELTKAIRKTASRTEEFRVIVQRTIPILTALVNDHPDRFDMQAQLAFAYKDLAYPPSTVHITQALQHLNQAIALRPPSAVGHTWKYDLNRAILRIHQEQQMVAAAPDSSFPSAPDGRQHIVHDLLTVAQHHGLEQTLHHGITYRIPHPIWWWIERHQVWLQQHPGATDWVNTLRQACSRPGSASPATANPYRFGSAGGAGPERAPEASPPNAHTPDTRTPDTRTPDTRTTDEASLDRFRQLQRQQGRVSGQNHISPPSTTLLDRWSAALDRARPMGAVGTASKADLAMTGIVASHALANRDKERVAALAPRFRSAGAKFRLPPALLAALASRESACGAILTDTGRHPNAPYFGIMQLCDRHGTPVDSVGPATDPASQHHIDEAADLIATTLQQLSAAYPEWADESVLQGAIAAYNIGIDQVQMSTTATIDRGTIGQDYSSDILARAQFFAEAVPTLAVVTAEPSPAAAAPTR